jgi:hypothetical protein
MLGVLVLAGCATALHPDGAAALQERAIARWNFLIAHQGEKAYDYLTPGYRATKTREQYAKEMNNRPVRWTAAKYVGQSCEQDRCQVTIEVTYIARVNAGTVREVQSTAPVTENWIREQGQWYFLPGVEYVAPAIPPSS